MPGSKNPRGHLRILPITSILCIIFIIFYRRKQSFRNAATEFLPSSISWHCCLFFKGNLQPTVSEIMSEDPVHGMHSSNFILHSLVTDEVVRL